MLPLEVLERAQAEMINYRDTGMSVMEIGHRSAEFREIIEGAEEALRKLMNIPANYKILFLQGGASSQFAAVPMNLLSSHKCADYIVSGQFSKKAEGTPYASAPNHTSAPRRPSSCRYHSPLARQ